MRSLSPVLLFAAVLSSIATSTEEDAAWASQDGAASVGQEVVVHQPIHFEAGVQSRGRVRVGIPSERLDSTVLAQVLVRFDAPQATCVLVRAGSDLAEYGPFVDGIEESHFSGEVDATLCEIDGDLCWSEWELVVDGQGFGRVDAVWELAYNDVSGEEAELVFEEVF